MTDTYSLWQMGRYEYVYWGEVGKFRRLGGIKILDYARQVRGVESCKYVLDVINV